MSSGCHGPVSSKPGLVNGGVLGVGTMSLSRPAPLGIPTVKVVNQALDDLANCPNFPVTGSSNVSSQLGQGIFLADRRGGLQEQARRAVSAASISGPRSRVIAAMVCSTLTSRSFIFLGPEEVWKFLGECPRGS